MKNMGIIAGLTFILYLEITNLINRLEHLLKE